MAYQALYRKYRPSTFADFIDQDNIKKILVNSIKNNKISHAYLFSGPRGIGKTSMAKIFAKAINCDHFTGNDDVCDNCNSCVEANNGAVIIEIDAASNNGVDQIRDLKNKISIVPSNLKYKVYIIDEVHMLTNSAFNALLKTLEEPPSYVVFILATTEFYEVPETIVSRFQCFSFNRISVESMIERLKYIAKCEKISIEDDVIKEIAYYANGGLRDAIGMLDKLCSFTDKKITFDDFKSINGMISQEDIISFYNCVFEGNINEILKTIDKISYNGYDFKNFIERVMLLVRDKIVDYYMNNGQISGNIEQNIDLVSVLNDVLNRLKEAINPIVIVQVYVLKFIEDKIKVKTEKIISQEIISESKIESEVVKTTPKSPKKKEKASNKSEYTINEENKNIRINNAMATANIDLKKELTNLWKRLDEYYLDEKYGRVAQLLADTEPMVVGKSNLILTTISDGIINNIYKNIKYVEDFIDEIYHHMSIVVLLNKDFDVVKEKYIEDRKNNIIYQEQEECGTLISETNDLVNQAIDLFGKDLVDIE